MPEYRTALEDHADAVHRESLRELFSDYKVTIISSFYYRNRAPWGVEWRTCPDEFFLFPALGNVRVLLETGDIDITPGEFLMLPEKTPHALQLPENFERLHQLAVHCHIHDRWGRPLLPRCQSVKGRLQSRVHSMGTLKELTCVMAHDPQCGQLRGESLIKELIAFQLQQGMKLAPLQANEDPRVSRVLLRMEQEFAFPGLSIEELARGVGITSVQLRKLFRRETHFGPKQFLNKLRLRKAAQFLRQTTASIKQVAADCGFASDHYFHLAFRKEFGATPSGYRTHSTSEI